MLTQTQERYLIRSYHTTGNRSAQEQLFQAFEPMIRRIVAEYHVTDADREDLHQEAALGFTVALNNYDLESGYRLSTYARHRVRGFVTDYARKTASLVRIDTSDAGRKAWANPTFDPDDTKSASFDATIRDHSAAGHDVEEEAQDAPNVEELFAQRERETLRDSLFLAFSDTLDPMELDIWTERMLQDQEDASALETIAGLHETSASTVLRRERAIRARLATYLEPFRADLMETTI